ncbi:hypothetical protein D3C71_1683640 [compost metagenome]
MTVVGRIVQCLVEFFPLLAQAFFDALAQALEQSLALSGTQKTRKRIEDDQHLREFGTGRHGRVSLGHLRHAPLCGLGLMVLEQVRRQHFAIT